MDVRRQSFVGARVAVLALSIGFLSAHLAPAQLLVVAGLAFGYLAGVPAAMVAIAVPVRVSIPLLHSLSWADAVIVGTVLCEMDRGGLRIRSRWGAVAAFSGLAVCSMAFSIDRTLTLRALTVLVEGLLLALATRNYVARRPAGPDDFLCVWLILGLFSAIAALVLFYFADPLVWWNLQKPSDTTLLLSDRLRLGSPFWGASNYYASISLLFLPIAWVATLIGRHRGLAAASLAVMVPALYLTTSRGAVFALGVGAVYLVVRILRSLPQLRSSRAGGRRTLGLMITGAAVAGLVLAGPQLINYFFLSRNTAVGSFASPDRLLIYQTALSLVPSHLLAGVGYGAAFRAAPELAGGAHSYLVTLLLELGLPGLILGIWAAWGALQALARHARAYVLRTDGRAVLVRGAFAALVLTVLNVQVEASLEGVVFFWLFSSLMGAALGSIPTEEQTSR